MTTRLNWQSTNNINDQSIYTTHWRYTNHLTLKMTSAQVVETSVNVTLNSPSQDYTHPDDRTPLSYDMTPGFKPFTRMGLFLTWRHKLLCTHFYKDVMQCKSVCDVKQGIDPCPLFARSWDRWWLDFVTFTAYKKSIFGWKRRKTAQYVSDRCKDLYTRKKYFGVRCTLMAAFWRLNFKSRDQ